MPEKEGVTLTKKPKGAAVIEGFPGFGLVGTIATGFLLDHLKCEQIGKHFFEEPPATLAIHEGRVVDPIGIYYNKKYNLVIVHAITGTTGLEWRAADVVLDVCKQVQAKRLITLEGVGSPDMEAAEEPRAFFYTNEPSAKKIFEHIKLKCLGEGIIVGVTSALILKSAMPTTSLFAETHSQLPDSKAAAKVIEVLDKLLGLEVDYKPLLKQAEVFEKKIKGIMEKAAEAKEMTEQKQLSYVG